jgi:uncharacterized protein YbjT (DUF2867 family)
MAEAPALHVVTGAFGFTGKYLAQRLLGLGLRVRTLTGHPDRPSPFGDRVEARPFRFDDPAAMAEDLRGAAILYNTYWIRFPRGDQSFEQAAANSRALFQAARQAGVPRIVHISIANPSADSPYPYYSGKAQVEEALRDSGLSYAILRPTAMFGKEDILFNNIGWLLRRLPVFGIFGDGTYRIQPVFVEDVAALMMDGAGRSEDVVLDAVGPETHVYNDLIALMRARLGSRARVIHVPPALSIAAAAALGRAVGDVIVTPDEVHGLMDSLLVSQQPPTCPTRFTEYLAQHAEEIGKGYQSETKRHYR